MNQAANKILTSVAPAAFIFMFCIVVALAAAEKKSEKPEAPEKEAAVIHAESGYVDLEKRLYVVPGAVTVKMRDMTVTGNRIEYDEKQGILRFLENPVRFQYGDDIEGTVNSVTADLRHGMFSGADCTMRETGKDWILDGEVAAVEIDTERDTAKASGARFVYRDLRPPAPAPEEEKETAFPKIKADVVTMSADNINYNLKEKVLHTQSPVRVEIEDGRLLLTNLRADLKRKTIETNREVEAQLRDLHFLAGRLSMDYGKKIINLDGGIRAERGEEHFTSGSAEIGYASGSKYFSLPGPSELKMMIKRKKSDGGEK